MYGHSKENHQFEGSPPPHTSYFVCSTPRCGSSVFCEALCNTRLAGAPTEYFDESLMERFWKRWGIDFDDPAVSLSKYIAALFAKKTSPNGVFGCKVHCPQYRKTFGLDPLPIEFPNHHYIWIQRRDRIAQAVSYSKAFQSDLWVFGGKGNGKTPDYDPVQIKEFYDRIGRENDWWNSFFQQNSIEPKVIWYEDFSQQLLSTVVTCLGWIDIEIPNDLSIEPISLVKQSDEMSAIWYERFQFDVLDKLD